MRALTAYYFGVFRRKGLNENIKKVIFKKHVLFILIRILAAVPVCVELVYQIQIRVEGKIDLFFFERNYELKSDEAKAQYIHVFDFINRY